jgi:radical SAM superfamily enzyme YgiQ (UPF0313 family)
LHKDKKYTLFLISPGQKYINYPAHSELAKIMGKKRLMIPLALPTLAAMTPGHYIIRIIDEETEEIPEDIPDIVGITTLAATIKRAYEIGDRFRSKGTKVVFGGAYASFMTDEALLHADAVVVGEAEGLWQECLRDFEDRTMKHIYRSDSFVPYKTQRPPRWDLVDMSKIFQVAIQVSRGCPFDCEFCLVSKIFGKKLRYREIDDVVAEIKAAPVKYFFFVDDNLTINKKYAKELMRAILPLGISWGCMCSIDVANDDELLQLMAEAGCFNILIGFESLNPESLDESHKHHNQAATIYESAIRKIHKAGIQINASFVVGFDHDDLKAFDDIFDFTLKTAMPNVNLHILAAPPGSEICQRFEREGRLISNNSELGVGHFPTLHYMNISQIDLFDAYMRTIGRLYSYETIYSKAVSLFSDGTFTRPGVDISTFLKMRFTWIILKEFIPARDKYKRKLLFFILKLIREKKIAVDKGFSFLVSMLGYHRHIRDHGRHMEQYRKLILAQDKGPWKNMKHGHGQS